MGLNFIDQYSYLHFASGIIAYFFDISLLYWLIIHTVFEIMENTENGIFIINKYLTFWPGGKPYKDSFINSVGDTLFSILGWYSAYKLDILGSKYKFYEQHIY